MLLRMYAHQVVVVVANSVPLDVNCVIFRSPHVLYFQPPQDIILSSPGSIVADRRLDQDDPDDEDDDATPVNVILDLLDPTYQAENTNFFQNEFGNNVQITPMTIVEGVSLSEATRLKEELENLNAVVRVVGSDQPVVIEATRNHTWSLGGENGLVHIRIDGLEDMAGIINVGDESGTLMYTIEFSSYQNSEGTLFPLEAILETPSLVPTFVTVYSDDGNDSSIDVTIHRIDENSAAATEMFQLMDDEVPPYQGNIVLGTEQGKRYHFGTQFLANLNVTIENGSDAETIPQTITVGSSINDGGLFYTKMNSGGTMFDIDINLTADYWFDQSYNPNQ